MMLANYISGSKLERVALSLVPIGSACSTPAGGPPVQKSGNAEVEKSMGHNLVWVMKC